MIYKRKPRGFNAKFEVVSCFLEHGGKILLLHRQDHKPQGDTWGPPAGKIEDCETPIKALLRELREETSHTVSEKHGLIYFDKVYVRYPTFDFVFHIFQLPLENRPRVAINPTEHKKFIWVSPKNALKMNLIHDLDNCIKLLYKLT